MRILHAIHRYHPATGGSERYIGAISEHLVRQGHSVDVITSDALDFELFWDPSMRRHPKSKMTHNGVNVRYFPVEHVGRLPGSLGRALYPMMRLSAATLASLAPNAAKQLAKRTPYLPEMEQWLAEEAPAYDLIAVSGITFEGIVQILLEHGQRTQTPVVIYPLTHLGAGERPGQDRLSRFYTLPHQIQMVLAADHILTINEEEKAFYLQNGARPEQISTVGSGIFIKELAGGEGLRWRAKHRITSPIVISLGLQSFEKGTRHTIEALRLLWQSGHEAKLVLAGRAHPDFEAYLEQLPSSEKGNILQLGAISEKEKRDLLDAADLLCMPSRTDSFGIVYLEAWAYGKPVIGARTWGVMDFVIENEVNGLLVRFGDVDQLREVLERLLGDAALRLTLGRNGRKKLHKRFLWSSRLQAIEEIYEQVAGAKAAE